MTLNIIIFFISTLILLLGLVNLGRHDRYKIVLTVSVLAIGVNALDVFTTANLTTFRQVAYLAEAVIIAYYAIQYRQ